MKGLPGSTKRVSVLDAAGAARAEAPLDGQKREDTNVFDQSLRLR